MGEFVESSLENLLPILEEVASAQLLTMEEVGVFVKRCRRYEYRLQKREKTPEDFTIYADYLSDLLELLRIRRMKINCAKNKKQVEREIERKILSLLRACCLRFMGQMELWRKLIVFLKRKRMYNALSKIYTSCLQFNNRNVELYGEAAMFELVSNASVENARVILQLAIRRHTDSSHLFITFFHIEVLYAHKILARREYLKRGTKKPEDTDEPEVPELNAEDVSDAILNLQVAEVVIKNALRAVKEAEKGDMLNEMWTVLTTTDTLIAKEAIERVRELIESEIEKLSTECKHSFLATKAARNNEDVYDVYENAVDVCPTEDMFRRFLKYCQLQSRDPIAASKMSFIMGRLIENGWANEQDYKTCFSNISSIVEQSDADKILDRAIEDHPESAAFWSKYLQSKIQNLKIDEKNIGEIFELFNKALEQIPSEESAPVWEILIDFAIQHSPKNVEKIFDRAFLVTSSVVSSQIKNVRVNYLNALVSERKISEEDRVLELYKLIQQKPNRPSFYLHAAEAALSWNTPDVNLAKSCYNFAVSEHSADSPQSWLAFIKFSYKHDIHQVSKLYQRAMTTLDKQFADEFIAGWTKLSHKEAAKALKVDVKGVKRQVDDIKEELGNFKKEKIEY